MIATLIACGGGGDGDDDGTNLPPVSTATCLNTSASCGQTIAGALCTSSNGGSCVGGAICSASGTCGPPPCSAADPDSCSGETICIGTTCEAAFPRFYTLTVGDVTIAQRDDNGECWDAACGAPDPFLVILVNGAELGRTSTRQDVFSASFDEAFDIELVAGSELRVAMFDEDLTDDDIIVACGADSLDAATIRLRDLACAGDTSVAFTLVPR